AAILAEPATRSRHVAAILQFAQANGFAGIDIDYEIFAFGDPRATWTTTRPNWVAFVIELAAALHGVGKTLTVSVPPQYDPERTGGDRGYWVYDYEAIGPVVDFIRIMAYDYSTSSAGPIAPLDWVEGLVRDAAAMVEPHKLILGVPVYGYNWPVSTLGVCPPDAAPTRRNQSAKSALALAAERGVTVRFDDAVAEANFDYNDHLSGVDAAGAATACTVTRRVWFSNAQAVFERAWIASRHQLAGIGIWSLGSDEPAVWQAIDAVRAGDEQWLAAGATTGSTAGSATGSG
ncbi:MAG TPA: glycosyl hydrolase family 18 protein, partial [Ilumatobacteraceae bacterium]|nr:glycosyl hydrolase family 18 protein [Ilumatobacteraceae bacterium]